MKIYTNLPIYDLPNQSDLESWRDLKIVSPILPEKSCPNTTNGPALSYPWRQGSPLLRILGSASPQTHPHAEVPASCCHSHRGGWLVIDIGASQVIHVVTLPPTNPNSELPLISMATERLRIVCPTDQSGKVCTLLRDFGSHKRANPDHTHTLHIP